MAIRLFNMAFAITTLLSTSVASAQQQTPGVAHKAGRILGVFDAESGDPIPDAEVLDVSTDSAAHTEVHGLVELSHFRSHNDSLLVNISKDGFVDTTLVVMVGAADTVPLQVNLRHADMILPAFVAMKLGNTPNERHMAEFESRRHDGVAAYVPRDSLARYDEYTLAEYMRAGHGCGVALSINGQQLATKAVARATYDRKIKEFEGYELYWKFVPLVFTEKDQVPPGCVMVLWTRIPRPGGGQ